MTASPSDRVGGRRGSAANLRGAPQMLEYRAIARRIAADGARSVLAWGCGWGQNSRLMQDNGLDVSPFDFRPDGPEEVVALERFPGLEARLSADPVRLPYDADRFDAVLSCGVLEHVAYPGASLAEIRRVLKPGGTIYVYKLPNRRSYLEKIARLAGMYYHGELPDDRVYTRRTATSLLEMSGYEVLEARLANLLPLTTGDRLTNRYASTVWQLNAQLERVPLLSWLATNVNVVARAQA